MTAKKIVKLMVFDLDCTLWPFHVECSYQPPFKMSRGEVVDARRKVMQLYPEVREVLEKWSKKCPIAAASRTRYPEGAEVLLDLFDINKYFTYKEIYPGEKITHFKNLQRRSNVDFKDMMFFDDENRNLIDVATLGMQQYCLIDENKGVTKKIVDDGVAHFFPDT